MRNLITRKRATTWLVSIAVAIMLGSGSAWLLWSDAANATEMLVYKSPTCGCCGAWVKHLQANGFTVTVKEVDDIEVIKDQQGVLSKLRSCHTGIVDGYTIEGHVPAMDIKRLLAERPIAKGVSVPGMPVGSPGMEDGTTKEPYSVILFSGNKQSVYAEY